MDGPGPLLRVRWKSILARWLRDSTSLQNIVVPEFLLDRIFRLMVKDDRGKRQEYLPSPLSHTRIREEQREKARLRAARNRASKRIAENDDTVRNSASSTVLRVLSDTEEQGASHSCPGSYLHPLADSELPSLKKVRQLITVWQSEWGVESTWPKKFHEQLKHVQGSGCVWITLKKGGGLYGF
ncbi:hypothetical protein SCLCIDRAFT_9955 [Scleroderma citrinum Foug A]|uniref:Uncharacterized protein n=1 Tax=Scleroderma citrinum Foug A TaxID=1036808 RepID=A0A0C3DTW5_9AGAM|nr:hypothetical protein SCLCIDRAFT_9955 [Scleroderma citrinum Foug A]